MPSGSSSEVKWSAGVGGGAGAEVGGEGGDRGAGGGGTAAAAGGGGSREASEPVGGGSGRGADAVNPPASPGAAWRGCGDGIEGGGCAAGGAGGGEDEGGSGGSGGERRRWEWGSRAGAEVEEVPHREGGEAAACGKDGASRGCEPARGAVLDAGRREEGRGPSPRRAAPAPSSCCQVVEEVDGPAREVFRLVLSSPPGRPGWSAASEPPLLELAGRTAVARGSHKVSIRFQVVSVYSMCDLEHILAVRPQNVIDHIGRHRRAEAVGRKTGAEAIDRAGRERAEGDARH